MDNYLSVSLLAVSIYVRFWGTTWNLSAISLPGKEKHASVKCTTKIKYINKLRSYLRKYREIKNTITGEFTTKILKSNIKRVGNSVIKAQIEIKTKKFKK